MCADRPPGASRGAPIYQLLFWVPQSGSMGTGVSMFTYSDEVQIGVVSDRSLIPEPGELMSIIERNSIGWCFWSCSAAARSPLSQPAAARHSP